MKRIFTLLMVLGLCTSSYAVHTVNWAKQFQDKSEIKNLSPEMTGMVLKDFLNMTPKKYKKMTGKRLGFKNTVKMKVAQKMLKKKLRKDGSEDIPKGLYVVLAILGAGWIAMGVLDDWSGNDWITSLLLYCLCGLPGIIYTLVKMKNYY